MELKSIGACINDNMFRKRIVWRINSSKIQQRFLAEKELILDRTVDLTRAIEAIKMLRK